MLDWKVKLYKDVMGQRVPESMLPSDFEDAVDKCLGFLSDRDAEVVRLRYMEGKTLQQASEQMGLSISGVTLAQRRAIARLKQSDSQRLLALGLKPNVDFELEASSQGYAEQRIASVLGVNAPNININAMGLTIRVQNALYRAGLRTVFDMAVYYEKNCSFLHLDNIGKLGEENIWQRLRALEEQDTAPTSWRNRLHLGDPTCRVRLDKVNEAVENYQNYRMPIVQAVNWLRIAEKMLGSDQDVITVTTPNGLQTLTRQQVRFYYAKAVQTIRDELLRNMSDAFEEEPA